ncbi:MAG TPA: hypothetical protein VG253_22705 [Streptosporangiaceae bacterium]|jgi:hypothetical protein|nr:hypothetical protein [Streptosporangiaceae bacterium]
MKARRIRAQSRRTITARTITARKIKARSFAGGALAVAIALAACASQASGADVGAKTGTKTGTKPRDRTAASHAPLAGWVTYLVTGSSAQVTYGPQGSSVMSLSPMKASSPLGGARFYVLQAQLQGSGSVTCQLQINGRSVAVAHASGADNVALCSASRDPATGKWLSYTP